jgi:molybdopterin/thiamine biosynthesis adenylyltransferase
VEKTGKLCLTPGPASFSPARPRDTIRYLLEQACQLLEDSATGKNREDFILEFQSYWPGHLIETAIPFWSLLHQKEESRLVHYWPGNRFTLFAETPAECREWIKNLDGGVAPKNMEIFPSVFVWSNKPIYPADYPATSAAFRRLALSSIADIDKILIQVAPQAARTLPVMFGFLTAIGPVFAGLVLKEPKVADTTGKQVRNCKTDGFRQGKMPAEVLLNRYFGGMSAIGASVFRADAAWIHARGGNGGNSALRQKRVGIFGCGSLGADVAFLLAKSGLGAFYLTDDQVLSLDNIGRHLLGADYTRQNKTDALETFLKKQLPTLSIETSGGRDIESVLRETPGIFETLDLIICTTGDWASECALNVASRQWPNFPPIIFGWPEAYGIAGHALMVNNHGGCLACGMTEHGSFEKRVVDWQSPDKALLRATGCGDFYQPYGATDVAPTKAMIAELALEFLNSKLKRPAWRTWVGDLSRLANLGGNLHDSWNNRFPSGEQGRKFFNHDWERNPQCPLCN